jgi:hypothetical protein
MQIIRNFQEFMAWLRAFIHELRGNQAKRCPMPNCRRVFYVATLKGTIRMGGTTADAPLTEQPVCDDCWRAILADRAQLIAEHNARPTVGGLQSRG